MSPTAEERLAGIEATLLHTATKEDLQPLRAEVHAFRAEMIKWMVGTGIGVAGVTATVVVALMRRLAP